MESTLPVGSFGVCRPDPLPIGVMSGHPNGIAWVKLPGRTRSPDMPSSIGEYASGTGVPSRLLAAGIGFTQVRVHFHLATSLVRPAGRPRV